MMCQLIRYRGDVVVDDDYDDKQIMIMMMTMCQLNRYELIYITIVFCS